jgi:transposase-like protein
MSQDRKQIIHLVDQALWRAVDQDGDTLDILVQSRKDTNAARKFFRKLLKGQQYSPNIIVTDKLKSYGAAHRKMVLTPLKTRRYLPQVVSP